MEKGLYQEFLNYYPLIKLFIYNEDIYAYDARSNFLVKTEEKDIVNLVNKAKNTLTPNEDLLYSKFQKRGVFSPGGLDKLVPNNDEIITHIDHDILNTIPRKFTMEVTQECNLKCNYCLFSQEQGDRVHNNKKMSKETAKQAIDFYYNTYCKSLNGLGSDRVKK